MDNFDKVRKYWDKLASANINVEFKDHWLNGDGTPVDAKMYVEVANFVLKHARDSKNQILEIGCGTGRILNELIVRGCENLTGIDFSEAQIDICKQRKLNCDLRVGDFFQFRSEFSEKSFDLIFLHSVTQYFPSSDYFEKFLYSVVEALKPGGKILLIDVPISWYKEEMISYSRKDRFIQLIKNKIPEHIINKIKSLRPDRLVKERIGNAYIEYEAFNGYYVDPATIDSICREHNLELEMLYQPFREKPVNFRKFRPIFILSDTIIDNC